MKSKQWVPQYKYPVTLVKPLVVPKEFCLDGRTSRKENAAVFMLANACATVAEGKRYSGGHKIITCRMVNSGSPQKWRSAKEPSKSENEAEEDGAPIRGFRVF